MPSQPNPNATILTVITRLTALPEGIAATVVSAIGPEVVQALARVQEALPLYRTVPVLPYDEAAATHFTRPRHMLPHHPGTQDLCIVAIALRHGTTLVTRHQRDLQGIAGVLLDDWSEPDP